MALYRKKPVIIEAFKLGIDPFPDWFVEKVKNQEIFIESLLSVQPVNTCYCEIHTPEGIMGAYGGEDYIIKGTQGEIYPCKVNIFCEIYEEVEENA